MSSATCYRILGLRPGATAPEVHRAYKRLALKHHPDRNAGDDRSHRLFCQVTEAYANLKKLLRAHDHGGDVCPDCGEAGELFHGTDGRSLCGACLLATRRRFLPLPTFQQIRCIAAILFQALAAYFVVLSLVVEDRTPSVVGICFALAALAALSWDFLRSDVISR
ncbi:MAG: J domain-containing protein [Planctomycetota bacterium]